MSLPNFDYDDVLEIVRRVGGSRTRMRLSSPAPIVMKSTTTSPTLYGIIIYVVGKGVVGQLLDYFEYKTRDGEVYWHITYGIVSLYAKISDRLIIPVSVAGFLTPDVLFFIKSRRPRLLEFRHVLGEMPNVPRDTIVNLEQIWSGEENGVLIIDPYRLLGRSPAEIEREVVQVKSQLGQLKMLYASLLKRYETERSRRVTAEGQVAQLKDVVEDLRLRVSTLQEAVTTNEQQLLEIYNRLHALQRRLQLEGVTRTEYESAIEDMESILSNSLKMLSRIKSGLEELFAIKEEGAGKGEGGKGGEEK